MNIKEAIKTFKNAKILVNQENFGLLRINGAWSLSHLNDQYVFCVGDKHWLRRTKKVIKEIAKANKIKMKDLRF